MAFGSRRSLSLKGVATETRNDFVIEHPPKFFLNGQEALVRLCKAYEPTNALRTEQVKLSRTGRAVVHCGHRRRQRRRAAVVSKTNSYGQVLLRRNHDG